MVFDYQEPGEEIVRLIELGEGKTIEFKEAESDNKDKWKKTVVAFANTEGGYILFGVNNDGQVVGLNKDLAKHRTLEHFKDGLSNAILNAITPVPLFEFLSPVKIEGKDVLAIKVISDDQAHSLFFEKAHHFYIRRDATTRDANNFEIQELVRRKDMIWQAMQPINNTFDLSSF
jgi:ATP-dependent DNA helicase RecG